MNKGWIKLFRQITDSWLWDDKPFSYGQAWIDLLLMANHEDKKFPMGSQIVTVQRGSFITSELKLMARWGWGKAKTRRFLNLLESDGSIIKKSNHKQTAITIVNWANFQDGRTTDRPLADHEQTTDRPLADTNKNEKNNKECKEVVVVPPTTATTIQKLWNAIPHVQKISGIKEGTKRYAEMQAVLSIYSEQDVFEAIKKIGESEYFQNRGQAVFFDKYINRNVLQMVLEGAYDKSYKEKEVEPDGLKWDL